jgi:hypothetical protein
LVGTKWDVYTYNAEVYTYLAQKIRQKGNSVGNRTFKQRNENQTLKRLFYQYRELNKRKHIKRKRVKKLGWRKWIMVKIHSSP